MGEESRGAVFIVTCFVCTCLFFVFLIFFVKNPVWFTGACIFVLVCCAALALNFVARQITRPHYQEIPQYGLLERDLLGRGRAHAPLSIAEPRAERQVKEIIPIPTVAELLKEGVLGTNDLLLGYTVSGSPHWGSWSDVRTFAIAGKGRSGKTVTMFFLIIQVILNGGVVWVADPHYRKKSSITALLKPLESAVRFAGTSDEIGEMVNDYIDKMESRVSGNDRDETPVLLVIDEYTLLAEENERAQDAVVACAQQYAGYGGYAMIAGHEWTGNGKKLVKMRRALHAKFVHRLDEGYAKYLLNSSKHAKIAEKLRTGNNFFQDTEGEIHELRTPLGTVEDALTIARQYARLEGPETPPEIAIYPTPPLQLIRPETRTFSDPESQGETPDFTQKEQILSLPAPQETPDFTTYQGRKEGVRRMLGKFNKTEIIRVIWGAKPGGSPDYKDASKEFDHIRGELATEELQLSQ